MFNKINLQYLISYFGIFPYLILLIDKYIFFQIEEKIFLNFIFYYTLIIAVFIGSLNWDLLKRVSNYKIIHGFLPSFFALVLIILNLYGFFNIKILILLIIIFILLQLFLDFVLIYKNLNNKNSFYYLRLPLTIFISLALIFLQL